MAQGNGLDRILAPKKHELCSDKEIMTKEEKAKAAREAKKAKAEAEERRVNELRRKRAEQLKITRSAVERIKSSLQQLNNGIAQSKALSSHVEGFYEEIGKLAKNRTLLEVTDLAVEQANHIIHEAKAIIKGDAYLERVKEFVPAGNNPFYPDVLLTARLVLQSLERFDEASEARNRHLTSTLRSAKTIEFALSHYLENDDAPSEQSVRAAVGLVDGAWFKKSASDPMIPSFDSGGVSSFDFDRLDRIELTEYLSEELPLGGFDS
jgi:hypothetical protein